MAIDVSIEHRSVLFCIKQKATQKNDDRLIFATLGEEQKCDNSP